jgi:3,4-dehydroadipyl-CoA semialdehyde dehydrogenase
VVGSASAERKLESYLQGEWAAGSGDGDALINPSNGATVATASSKGLDLGAALEFSRTKGGAALRAMTFAERGALLGAIADVLAARRDDWNEIARINSGNTKSDAAIDVDGGIGTIKYFAKLATTLGDGRILSDGPAARLARDPTFVGLHLGLPLRGVAIQINAYNFPSWGLWGKAAVAILAGMPVLAKPATATAWLAEEMVRAVVDAKILPEGVLSLLCGSAGDLLDHVRFGDVIAFTGSAETGFKIRNGAQVQAHGVRVNIEADSLNSAVLAPDGAPGTPAFDLFCAEVVKEMVAKAGQKCTAIRRVFVPAAFADAASDAIGAGLSAVRVGDPALEGVSMGPLVHSGQKNTVEQGLAALTAAGLSRVDTGASVLEGSDVNGAFVAPVLLRAQTGKVPDCVHDTEVFGPVATLIPYASVDELFGLVRRGGGSLVSSVFANDHDFLAQAAEALGESHGRLLLVDPSVGGSHAGHGIVLPLSQHGGPGRAGNGSELGALRGLWFYTQRSAIQASSATFDRLSGVYSEAVN